MKPTLVTYDTAKAVIKFNQYSHAMSAVMDLLHLAWLWADGSRQLTWLERWRQTFGTNCKAPSYLNLHQIDGHSSCNKHRDLFLQKIAALKVKGDSGRRYTLGNFQLTAFNALLVLYARTCAGSRPFSARHGSGFMVLEIHQSCVKDTVVQSFNSSCTSK
jgi:hypothetical protein